MDNKLPQRNREILEILISDYISTALPVGSKSISKKYRDQYSAATIRGILADLEDLGFLKQPHTSAGRIPTGQGLRYYVNSILQYRELSKEEQGELYKRYFDNSDVGLEELITKTSRALSAISKHVGLVSTSCKDKIVFKQIQFIPLSSHKLLGIFVSQEGFVQNKIIEISEEYTYSDLNKINNYCNNVFLGLTLEEAKCKIERELQYVQEDYDRLLSKAFLFSLELFDTCFHADIVLDGESHLVGEPDFLEAEKLRELLSMLEEKKQLLNILERCNSTQGVNIFIGSEFNSDELNDKNHVVDRVSLVIAPFKKGGKVLGTLGVVGPVRMDYSRIVSVVDFTAKLLENILE
ncbi:MAG: heat-inducible transcription repressor HrcA [Deltaproteobacteria bacterium CG07_land_8_20_14_0_80_38_7]|nr:MAG: heat-inducible transcription repressor HrcA [Deltaproteobacteria bacterium CG07_land_8_20_14_0_80_38_7]